MKQFILSLLLISISVNAYSQKQLVNAGYYSEEKFPKEKFEVIRTAIADENKSFSLQKYIVDDKNSGEITFLVKDSDSEEYIMEETIFSSKEFVSEMKALTKGYLVFQFSLNKKTHIGVLDLKRLKVYAAEGSEYALSRNKKNMYVRLGAEFFYIRLKDGLNRKVSEHVLEDGLEFLGI